MTVVSHLCSVRALGKPTHGWILRSPCYSVKCAGFKASGLSEEAAALRTGGGAVGRFCRALIFFTCHDRPLGQLGIGTGKWWWDV